jgi:hypothetical protein
MVLLHAMPPVLRHVGRMRAWSTHRKLARWMILLRDPTWKLPIPVFPVAYVREELPWRSIARCRAAGGFLGPLGIV